MAVDTLELALCLCREVDGACTVDTLSDGRSLLLDGGGKRIGELQGLRGLLLDGLNDEASQLFRTSTTFAEGRVDSEAHTSGVAMLTH